MSNTKFFSSEMSFGRSVSVDSAHNIIDFDHHHRIIMTTDLIRNFSWENCSIRLGFGSSRAGKKGFQNGKYNRNYENSFLCIFILINGRAVRDDDEMTMVNSERKRGLSGWESRV